MTAAFLTSILSLIAGQTPAPIETLPTPALASSMLTGAEPSANIPASPSPDRCGNLIWFNAEYLLWWTKGTPSGPLVTQGSLPGPGTVVYGNSPVSFDPSSGYRVGAGFMLGRDCPLFVEGSWMQLLTQTSNFSAVSNGAAGSPFIATLFSVPGLAGVHGEQLSLPTFWAGGAQIESTLSLQSWDLNLGWDSGLNCHGWHLALLGGFRSLDLEEGMSIQTARTDITGTNAGGLLFLGEPIAGGSTLSAIDSFRTNNQFYGGQFGAKVGKDWGAFSLHLIGKLALGEMNETVTIAGSSTGTPAGGAPVTVPGGIYALPSNIGHYSRDVFAVVPEGTLSVGWKITRWAEATVGYNFLYCSDVIRPGSTVDTTVNPSNIPSDQRYTGGATPARPAFPGFNGSGFWAQGINLGLTLRY